MPSKVVKLLWNLNNFGFLSLENRFSINIFNNLKKFEISKRNLKVLTPFTIVTFFKVIKFITKKNKESNFEKKINIQESFKAKINCQGNKNKELQEKQKERKLFLFLKKINNFLDEKHEYVEFIRNLNPLTNGINYILYLPLVQNEITKLKNYTSKIIKKKIKSMKSTNETQKLNQNLKQEDNQAGYKESIRMLKHFGSLFIGKNDENIEKLNDIFNSNETVIANNFKNKNFYFSLEN